MQSHLTKFLVLDLSPPSYSSHLKKNTTTDHIIMLFSKSTVTAVAILSLAACSVVHGEGHVGMGKPAMLVGYEPLTDVRDQVCT
jgi:ABC-type transporter Mla maintaining outer membrane lipid asymmetry permease subunit MlaE